MPRRPYRLLSLALAAGLVSSVAVFLAPSVQAVATRSFEIDDAASFAQGELHHAAVRSDGEVRVSASTERLALPPDVGIVWSSARGADGALYLGTGDQGRVYRVLGDRVELFAETGQLLVSALVFGEGRTLYAGTLPEGRLYAIDTSAAAGGQARELVRLGAEGGGVDPLRPEPVPAPTDGSIAPPAPTEEAAESIWALAWDGARRRLYAATGPHGRVYAIDARGHADVYWDSPAAHVQSLALAPDGALYAGTSDDAVVARITAPGRAEIVWDFPGNEIPSIALSGGTLVVAANDMPEPPAAPTASSSASATAARAARPRAGKGSVWVLGPDGRAERVYASDDAHVMRVERASDGVIYAAMGVDGRIIRVEPDRSSSVWIDADERQVLSMGLTSASPYFVTGDSAALYRVRASRPDSPSWTSKVLDAEHLSRFGQLVWRGHGAMRVETRSGNTARPDETWSAWSAPLTTPGPIRSPAARFLQVRVRFVDEDAVLRAVTAYYLPQNQRPVLTEVGLKARPTKRGADVDATTPPSSTLGLTWKVDNTDSDRLRYRLRFREETQTVWRDMLRDSEILSATEYSWNTASVPDGFYVVEVEASDELSNPDAYVLSSRITSEPLLVDNTPPEVIELVARGPRISGRARDTMGPIARIEIAIDGGDPRPIFPDDDLLDTRDERFSVDVTTLTGLIRPLGPGSHIASVRVFDAAGNQGASEVSFQLTAQAASRATPGR